MGEALQYRVPMERAIGQDNQVEKPGQFIS